MQSGISASQELQQQFKSLLSSPSSFALLATIEKEQLVPVTLLSRSSPDSTFATDLTSQLAPHLQPKVALYALLRRFPTAPYLTAVTYVPDAAPVRQKMLFASSRLTLVRDLGTEHFRDSLFATDAAELTPAGFERHEKHEKLEAPLTEEERVLGEVKRAEAEAGQGTGTKEIHLSQSFSMPVEDSVVEALKEMGSGGKGLVMLKINASTETVELVPAPSSTPTTIPELVSAISSTEPRFTFFRFAHSHGGGDFEPILFFYTCPANQTGVRPNIKFRMMYPLMKKAVLATAEKEAGVVPEKRFEVEEPSEITEQMVMDDLHPKVSVRQGFSRPKRPGK